MSEIEIDESGILTIQVQVPFSAHIQFMRNAEGGLRITLEDNNDLVRAYIKRDQAYALRNWIDEKFDDVEERERAELGRLLTQLLQQSTREKKKNCL